MNAIEKIRIQNRVILHPVFAEIIADIQRPCPTCDFRVNGSCSRRDCIHDEPGFGNPQKLDDYRAWPDPDQARKLRAESVDLSACPYCGRSPCPGTHADCRSA
jgi:hypothetical protein